jgi:hemolysin activation/secretion protein
MKNNDSLKSKPLQLLAALLATFPMLALGQGIPGAGTMLQQVQPSQPVQPSSAGPAVSAVPATALKINKDNDASTSSGVAFSVKVLQIQGNTLFDTETLQALVAQAEGQTMPLNQLEAQIASIAAYYSSQGYPLVRVVIPAQTVRDGVVRVQVIEGRYGNISLNNSSQVKDELLQVALAPLASGNVVSQAELDQALLLLSDVPGVRVNGVLKPGQALGASDLVVDTTQSGPAVAGSVVLDNGGNRFTGRTRIAGTVVAINPLQHGDVLSISALSSGQNMNYGRLAYDVMVDARGTHLGGSLSVLRYSLGQSLEVLNAHGNAEVASLWLKHPFVRSLDVNLYGKIQFDRLLVRDRIDVRATRTDRHINNLTGTLEGDLRDKFLAGAITSWNLGGTVGRVGFDDDTARALDDQSARSTGQYTRWNANFARLQGLTMKDALYVGVGGQWASHNLDASQKVSIGGPYTVRAYEVGAVSGDNVYSGTIELRHELESSGSNRWQAIAFIDSAHVVINKNVWAGVTGTNNVNLSGAGLGINWTGAQQWSGKLHVATPIGSHPTLLSGTPSTRAAVELGFGF